MESPPTPTRQSTKENFAPNDSSDKSAINDFSSSKKNYSKFKLLGLGVLLILFIVLIGVYTMSETNRQKDKQKDSPVAVEEPTKPTNSENSSLSPTSVASKNIDPNAWEITVSNDELISSSNLLENILIYATKNEYRSTVYKRNMQTGTQTKILEFDEQLKAGKSGNLWEGLPPNMALSPNKNEIVYIDQEGLKLYDLKSENTKVFIRQTTKQPTNEDFSPPPQWSISTLNGTYTLARPLWSSNGRYISFLQGGYEGASFGLFDSQTNQYYPTSLEGGYRNLKWSPTDTAYVKTMYGGYEGTGLFASSSDITKQAVDLSSMFDKQNASFLEVNYSSDGKRLAFTFNETQEPDQSLVAIVNADGSGFTVLDEIGENSMPFFSSNGYEVFYVQNRGDKQVLIKYDLTAKKSSDFTVLPEEFNRWRDASWTEEGFLTIVGVSSSSDLTLGGNSTRLLIFDLQNQKVIYASPTFTQFVTFAGFSKN